MGVNLSKTQIETAEEKKITKHFDFCYESSGFNEGDIIPIGGSLFAESTDDLKTGVIADFENFKDFFDKVDAEYEKADLTGMQGFLDRKGIDIPVEIFAITHIFSMMLNKEYPGVSSRAQIRDLLYQEHKDKLKISDTFKNGCAACAEIAAVAQEYLRRKNISASYFHGHATFDHNSVSSNNDIFPGAHSFVIIRHNGATIIYDPTNNTNYNGYTFQSLYSTEKDFDEEMNKGKKRLVTSTNLLTGEKAYYGTSNNTAIYPEHHIA